METIWSTFYEKLGSLFYSVASVDSHVAKKEIETLQAIVRKEFLTLEDSVDDFDEDVAFQIESVFDWMLDENMSSQDAFEIFSDFYKEHTSFFTDDLKRKITKTVNAIAYSFNQANKSELTFIFQLQKLFDSKG